MEFINEFFQVIDPIFLTGFITAVMAFVFNRVPKAKAWFDRRTSQEKQDFVVAFVVIAAVAVFSLDCYAVLNTNLSCEPKSIVDLLYAIVFGGTTSQSAHMLSNKKE